MKKIYLLIIAFLIGIGLFAQTPQAFKYQAIARDSNGGILANKVVTFRISILKGSISGASVYSELHGTTANLLGQVDLQIGKGTSPSGNFSGVNWGSDIFFVKIEMDPSGGTAFQTMGTSQLLSVPYALFARDVENKEDGDADPTNELQKISINGTILTLDKGGQSVTLPSSGGLTLPFEGTTQTTTLASSAFNVSNSADFGIGITGHATSTSGTNYGIQGRSSSTSGTGVEGIASASTGSTFGVTGRSASPSGAGVFGTSSASSGSAWGVFGSSVSPSGRAVGARSISSTGTTYGVHSQVISSTGFSGYFTGGKFYVSGNVGIDTESPEYRLDVYAPGTGSTGLAVFRNSSGDQKVQIRQNSNGAGAVYVYKTGNEQTIALLGEGNSYINGGSLGIGTTAPTQALHVIGNAYKTVGGTSWAISSDLRLKNVLGDYNKGLEEIVSLNAVRYQYMNENPRQLDPNVEQVGFVAQEVQKIFPEAVTEGIDGYLDFNMHEINVALVNAVKELSTENELLRSQNDEQQSRIEGLESRLSKLESQLKVTSDK